MKCLQQNSAVHKTDLIENNKQGVGDILLHLQKIILIARRKIEKHKTESKLKVCSRIMLFIKLTTLRTTNMHETNYDI